MGVTPMVGKYGGGAGGLPSVSPQCFSTPQQLGQVIHEYQELCYRQKGNTVQSEAIFMLLEAIFIAFIVIVLLLCFYFYSFGLLLY